MGPVPHGRATATEVLRRAIQHNHESLRGPARRYGINQKTVAKRKKRTSTADLPMPESGGAKVGHGSGGIMLLRAE